MCSEYLFIWLFGYLSFFLWKSSHLTIQLLNLLFSLYIQHANYLSVTCLMKLCHPPFMACFFPCTWSFIWKITLNSHSRRICLLFFFIVRTFICLVEDVLSSKVIEFFLKKFPSKNLKSFTFNLEVISSHQFLLISNVWCVLEIQYCFQNVCTWLF